MLKTKEVQIDERLTVTIKALPATEASDVMYRLSSALGPAFGTFIRALENDGNELDLKVFPEALEQLFKHLPAAEFRALREKLLAESTFTRAAEGDEPGAVGALLGKMKGSNFTNFDILFSGRVFAIFPVLWAAVGLNFGFSEAALPSAVGDLVRAAVRKFAFPESLKSAGPATDSSSSA